MKKRIIAPFLMLLSVALLGCQERPDNAVVISKNDGRFDANAAVRAEENHAPGATQAIYENNTFTSTDGTVEFSLKLDTTLPNVNMPILEVVPHYITEAEAKQAAEALFGNVDFWEWQHWEDQKLSAAEIQEKISRWSQFTSQEALDALWGYPQEDAVPVVKQFIAEYTAKLETAGKQSNYVPCQWKFQKAPYYLFSRSEAEKSSTSGEDDMLKAVVQIDGIPYTLQIGSRNQRDYKANYIRAYIESDSPLRIDNRYFTAAMCRTDKPADAQVENAISKATKILQNMELGEWKVYQCEVQERVFGEATEYMLDVRAVPVLNGIPAIYQAPIENLTETSVYASNYQMSNVRILFSPNGQLISFSLDSPLDIEKTVNDNVAVISMDELVNLAKTYLVHSTFPQYDTQMQIDPESKNIKCVVTIGKMDYALARIRVPDTEASYYYIPTVALHGDAEFYQKDTGAFCCANQNLTLLCLNAVDGTILNDTNT